MYTPTVVPYQTRVSFSWLDRPNTNQQITYVLGLKNTPASTLIMLGFGGPQLFVFTAEEVLQPTLAESDSDSIASDDSWEQVKESCS